MKSILAGLTAAFVSLISGLADEALAQKYADKGELIITQFVSAPFPHPNRREGHTYKGQTFSAAEHYSDSTVAIFIPSYFRRDGPVDFVIHFHGWKNDVAGTLRRYKLIDQL